MTLTPDEAAAPGAEHISETRAKGGRNLGFVWILGLSTLGALAAVALVWALFSGAFAHTDRHGGTGVTPADAARFHTPTVPTTPPPT